MDRYSSTPEFLCAQTHIRLCNCSLARFYLGLDRGYDDAIVKHDYLSAMVQAYEVKLRYKYSDIQRMHQSFHHLCYDGNERW